MKEVIQFINANSDNILRFLGSIFPLSLIFNLYQYKQRMRLETHNNEKDLEIKKVELATEKERYQSLLLVFAFRDTPEFSENEEKKRNCVEKIAKLEIEKEYLEKILNKNK